MVPYGVRALTYGFRIKQRGDGPLVVEENEAPPVGTAAGDRGEPGITGRGRSSAAYADPVNPLRGLPLSSRTSLAIDALTGTDVQDRGDHLILRTPANPTYHWGNFVQVTTGDVDDVDRWLAVFADAFPSAPHRAIGLPTRPDAERWEPAGLRVEADESLTLAGTPARTPTPDGYRVRELRSDADWAARLGGELAENRATGEYPDAEHRVFLQA